MLDVLLNAVFGCSHKRTTFPCTPIRRLAPSSLRVTQGTYVVCLDCGQEFSYDWQEMRMGEPVSAGDLPASQSRSLRRIIRFANPHNWTIRADIDSR